MDNTEDIEIHELETIERNLSGESATVGSSEDFMVFSPTGFMVFSPTGFMVF